MKNGIRDDIMCARASSDCRERTPNLMGQMKEVGDNRLCKARPYTCLGNKSTTRNMPGRLADTLFIKRN